LKRLGHALLDCSIQPRALWLLSRVADFLLKVNNGEWDTYHPLRQRVYFRQLAAEIAEALGGELGGSIPPTLSSECETSIREFLRELQAVRHFPEKSHRVTLGAGQSTRGSILSSGGSVDVNRL
jgi:hypothetical protein